MTSAEPRRQIRQSIVIWVDAYVETNSSDKNKTIKKLHKLVDNIKLIKTPARCIKFLNKIEATKCYVITSGVFGEYLVPKIHALEHVEGIFIFCTSKAYHKNWAKGWLKVRGVHTRIHSICGKLHPMIEQVTNDDIAMSIIKIDNNDQMNPKELPPSFMYSSMLKDIFLIMEFKQEHFEKMVMKLLSNYKGSNREIKLIEEFSRNYRPSKAIWWYTRQCFTYNDVNLCLRTLNADMIVDMAPFIVDLRNKIRNLYEQQSKTFGRNSFTVYRGQGMTKEAFHELTKSNNVLLSFDCFLSTSKRREVSLGFAEGGAMRPDHVGVLFIIKVDPSIHAVPYANIKEHSYYPAEDEILFSMHSIFKIDNFQTLRDHSNIFEVQLQLTDEDDQKLLELKKHMANENSGTPEHELGQTLMNMGESDKAEEVYLKLLDDTNERSKGLWNHQLGYIKDTQGKYEEAIEYYQKALEINKRKLPENDPEMTKTYNNIGLAFYHMGKYSEALEYHTKTLRLQERVLPENHSLIATSYNNIGSVYENMGDYPEALTNYEKANEIYEENTTRKSPSFIDFIRKYW